MYPYIVCFCGCCLADVWYIFKKWRADIYAKVGSDINPRVLAMCDEEFGDKILLGEVLDSLGFDVECCRTRMMTMVEYREYY